jgi:hypothetical protein
LCDETEIILSASIGGLNSLILESSKVVTLCPAALQSEKKLRSMPYASLRMLAESFWSAYPPPEIYSIIKRFKLCPHKISECVNGESQ